MCVEDKNFIALQDSSIIYLSPVADSPPQHSDSPPEPPSHVQPETPKEEGLTKDSPAESGMYMYCVWALLCPLTHKMSCTVRLFLLALGRPNLSAGKYIYSHYYRSFFSLLLNDIH